MTIKSEIQSLSPSAEIELFVFDSTMLPGGDITRFHAGTNELLQPVVWQGNTYSPIPVEASGFDIQTKGTLPRPRFKVANVAGAFSALALEFDDLIGCKVTRKRTYQRYLDAVNFTDGNATADPNQYLPDDLWHVERKVSENRYLVEWELSSAFDLQGVMLPFRQVIQNSCPWQYRSAECGYTGVNYFTTMDVGCAQGSDRCGKRLNSCKIRFGAAAVLPFGGFPGAVRYG